MTNVFLGDICNIQIGKTPSRSVPEYWGGDLPWVSIRDIAENRCITETKEKITSTGAKKSGSKIIPKGNLLLSFKLSLGKRAFAGCDLYTNEAIAALCPIDKSKVDINYLYWALDNISYDDYVDRAAKGKTLNKAKLNKLSLRLPSLDEQKRIAAILDAADALRARRWESITQLDALLKSTFLEMFGDPVINPMQWGLGRIGDLGEVITGNTPSRKCPEYYGDEIEWIKSDNINDPSLTLTKAKEGLSNKGKKIARTAPNGSILVTCIAGSRDCIGNFAIADREVAFNQQINAFIPNSKISFWYILGVFLTGKSLIQRASTNSMKGMVSKSAFSNISIPLPPLDLQYRFAAIFESVEKQQTRMRVHLNELDALFASLQHRAFTGEL
ncbi:restriction endonuclease subunit S [Kushneria sp. TE3]|uniref:restriction endonuclease subunit S n=1 Tax=Kushneria sp. TE3 TaxID=3449832 RepID=UPI003F6827FA